MIPVLIGGQTLKTPAGHEIVVPTAALAEAIAREERGFLRQMACTARDIVAPDRAKTIEGILAYAASDLLCHRAEHPPELIAEQQREWQPLLDWCAENFGARLAVGTGIVPVAQTPETLAALRRAIEAYDDWRLTGLSQAVNASGSLVLGLALAEGRINAAAMFAAAELDALWQMQKWGSDPAQEARHADIRREIELCASWFGLL